MGVYPGKEVRNKHFREGIKWQMVVMMGMIFTAYCAAPVKPERQRVWFRSGHPIYESAEQEDFVRGKAGPSKALGACCMTRERYKETAALTKRKLPWGKKKKEGNVKTNSGSYQHSTPHMYLPSIRNVRVAPVTED